MTFKKVCGNCIYGGDALDRYGNIDPNYVICQIKDAENRGRKPDRFQTISAVSRMHYHRDPCLQWRESIQPFQEPKEPEEVALQMVDFEPSAQTSFSPKAPAYSSAENGQEVINQLRTELIQKKQMIDSLQYQNTYLSEEITGLRDKLSKLEAKLKHAIYFDPALTGGEANYFEILGVTLKDRPEEIKRAYYLKMKTFHPDRFVMITRQINLAYETLTDPEKRMKYIHQLKAQNRLKTDE